MIIAIPEKARCLDAPVFSDRVMATFEANDPLVTFAAGDVVWTLIDDQHVSVMSCQHGRPMGCFAGHNVVCDLFGLPLLPLHIDWYATILDLGPLGAVYTEG